MDWLLANQSRIWYFWQFWKVPTPAGEKQNIALLADVLIV